ncbi:MAG: cobyrinate a,c-diamide synthase, partial [Desulfamplus sp.]|nr:cobyrinate a,c-diamide synthase [Desulfamplus sp.]
SEAGSTAQMAKWLGLPVILVVDARSMARSAAAIVQGFENFDHELEFAGVIFSKTGSPRHYSYLKEAVEANCRMKCLGHLPRNPDIIMPERHLGLVTSDEHKITANTVELLISMLDKNTSLREMVENLHETMPRDFLPLSHDFSPLAAKKDMQLQQDIRIAVARDKAFCFYYQENIEALQRHGASIVEFSPIKSSFLPPDIHGIYLGGGYPELFAQELSSNTTLMEQIRERSLQGMPIYGECGGFMYLCKDITGIDEIQETAKKYPMTGCFPFSAVMSKKMRSLGYRQVTLTQDSIIGKKGDILRGHEFHYSSLEHVNNMEEDALKQNGLSQ